MAGNDEPDLFGRLAIFPLPNLLQMLSSQQATGKLLVCYGARKLQIYLRQGLVSFVHSKPSKLRLGEYLVAHGSCTKADLDKALSLQKLEKKVPLGKLLLALNNLDRKTLRDALRILARENLYEAMMWPMGEARFYHRVTVQLDDLTLRLEVDKIILEAMRHLDEKRAKEQG